MSSGSGGQSAIGDIAVPQAGVTFHPDVWGYVFPVIALAIVLGMIFLARLITEFLRKYLEKIRLRSGNEKRYLNILGVVPLDPKRRVSAVEVNVATGKKLTVLVLTGGESDVCLGWINAEGNRIAEPSSSLENPEADI